MTPACGAAGFAMVVTLAVSGCSDEPDGEGRVKVDCAQTSATTLVDFARTPLPKTATTIEVFCSGATDTRVRARVVMPRRDLDAFLRDADLSARPRRGVRPIAAREQDPPAWKIERIENERGLDEDCLHLETSACSGLAGRRFVIDLDRPDRAVVYIEAFTT